MCKINGKKLGEIRENAGLTQEELAKQVGVTRSSIYNYERGKQNPSDEVIDKICMILRVKKDDVEIQDIGYDFTTGESKTVHKARQQAGFVRRTTPEETEKWIAGKRKVDSKQEQAMIKNALKAGIGFGDKKYISIDPTLIHIPEWQRDTDMAKAMEIAENWDDSKYDPIKIYLNPENCFNCGEGAHRVVGAILKNEAAKEEDKMKIIAEVLDCTEQEAMIVFLGQSAGRRPMTVNDMYRAAIKANIKEYTDFRTVFLANRIQITADSLHVNNAIGTIRPSREMLRMVKSDKMMLYKLINLIKTLEWCGSEKNAFVLRNFHVLKRLYVNFGEEVEQKLLANCKGAVFYESKVAPIKSDAELFDFLSAEINK